MKALIFPFLLLSCYLQAQTIDSVKVGASGGFSGQTTSYFIYHHKINKVIDFATSQQTITSMKKLRCKQSRTVKKGAQAIWSTEVKSFEHPSNVTKWLEIYSKGEVRKYTWGDPAFSPSALLTDYYQSLMDIVKTISFH